MPKSQKIYLQRFDDNWNEYIDVSQIKDVQDKDKLVIVVVDNGNGASQDNTVKVWGAICKKIIYFIFCVILHYLRS